MKETQESRYYAIMREYQKNPANFSLKAECLKRHISTPKEAIFVAYVPTEREATMQDAIALKKALKARRYEQEQSLMQMRTKKVNITMHNAVKVEEPVQPQLRTNASYLTTEELISELLNRGLQVTLAKA